MLRSSSRSPIRCSRASYPLPRVRAGARLRRRSGAGGPLAPYDAPLWSEPKVARDQHAQVAKALYSLWTLLVTAHHAATVRNLPLHHGDPFNRLLVAQP